MAKNKRSDSKIEEPVKLKKKRGRPKKAPQVVPDIVKPPELVPCPLAGFGNLSDNQKNFLEAFIHCGTVQHACKAAGIVHQSHYGWLHEEEYKQAFEHCKKVATENLIREARHRALCGMRRYKFTSKGNPLLHPVTGEPYFEEERSDGLLMFMIKQGDPTFRDTSSLYVDGKLKHSGNLEHSHKVEGFTVADLPFELQASILEFLTKKQNEANSPAEPVKQDGITTDSVPPVV